MTCRQILDDLLTRCANHGIYLVLDTYSVTTTFVDYPYPTTLIPNADAFANYVAENVDVLGSHTNLIIEPYNEPWTVTGWQSQSRLNEWQTVWQNVINAVRAVENSKGYVHHLIMVSGPGGTLGYWGTLTDNWMNLNWLASNPFSGDNLVLTIHCYRYWGSVGLQTPISSRPTDYTEIKNIYIAESLYYYSQYYPIYIGEIGGYTTISGEDTWLTNTLQILNEWGIGYSYYAWRDDADWQGTGLSMLVVNSEATTGGTVNSYGQILVNAIGQGG